MSMSVPKMQDLREMFNRPTQVNKQEKIELRKSRSELK